MKELHRLIIALLVLSGCKSGVGLGSYLAKVNDACFLELSKHITSEEMNDKMGRIGYATYGVSKDSVGVVFSEEKSGYFENPIKENLAFRTIIYCSYDNEKSDPVDYLSVDGLTTIKVLKNTIPVDYVSAASKDEEFSYQYKFENGSIQGKPISKIFE